MPLPASDEAVEYSGGDEADDPSDAGETSFLADPAAHGERLDKWLAQRLPAISRGRIQRWIEGGYVTVDGHAATVRHALRDGERVDVVPQPSDDAAAFRAEPVDLVVVHEDDAILVVDKPAGLVVHPAAGHWSGTLLNGLLHRDARAAGVPRAGIVHRLDKDTSGLMVVAKTIPAQVDLVRQLQARTVGRTYVAFVHGAPPATGRVDRPIGRDPRDRTRMASFDAGRPMPAGTRDAATRFTTLARTASPPVAAVACQLETGRTHQIRVHLKAIGHPLVGDPVYGGAKAPAFARQALHATRLALVHPVTRESVAWHSPLPDDMAALAQALGLDVELSSAAA